ncbi:MAG: ABC transporter substrate-binding protein [Sphingobacteriales bacterium UTBCD1]|jgi:peptide/nickel transport system substrate-binding protein|nr:MAG: ABC transporter substrate-binding protein [Sphingobacteriales bacterium UTBCD1]
MIVKRKYWLLITACILMISCYNKNKEERNVFHYNETTGIASLDPAFAKNQSIMWAVHQLYNTLVEVDQNLNIVPSLAKSWDVSDDRLVWTFHLRDDVFFHDDPVFPDGKGRKMTASDVVYSLLRIIDKETASPGAWIFNRKVDSLHPFTAVDDTTFQVRLIQPFKPMLGILSMQYCSVIAKEAVNKYGNDFRSHPVGTGPFQIVAWEEGQALVLKKNAHYFEKDSSGARLPYLDGIKISFYDSKATEFLLFREKQLEFINDIEASFKDEVLTKMGTLRKEWEGKIILQTHPYLTIEYFGILVDTNNMLVKNSPLRFKAIRQAINYGFDRRKMILYLRNSLGTPAESGFVPMGLPSFDSTLVKGYAYDPSMSKKLLAEASYPDGKGLPVIKLLTIPIYSDMADFVAKQLSEIGIPVQVEVVQKSLLLDMTANSRALFFRGSWIADYPDAENFLSVFYSKNPAPPNYTRYNNPKFDKLFDAALKENNDSLRYELYREADQLMIRDAPVVPLWYDEVVHFVQPYVKGFDANALNLLELRRTKLEK